VILVDWRESGFVPLNEAVWTVIDLRPLRDGDGVAARHKREKAW
jgi:hypothetical protein